MATVHCSVVPLGDLEVGQTGVCFAFLSSREEKVNKRNEPYFTCHFRANQTDKIAQVWSNNPCVQYIAECELSKPYRLRVVGEQRDKSYGSDLKILEIELAGPEHASEGFDPEALFPSSEIPKEKLFEDLRKLVQDNIKSSHFKKLLKILITENQESLMLMPAAKSFHHAYNSGLLEHVWSLTRICSLLADHYTDYYADLNPPLDKELILVAAIVHDIGKLREFRYDPFDVSYSVEGQLIGHIVLGRDMVREAASRVENFPTETLMLLEHAILSHHGRLDFASPVIPKTLEALILSFADDLDAKVNAAVRGLTTARPDSEFTDPIKPLENRSLYRRLPNS